MKTFFEAVRDRRSIYGLSKESPVPDSRLREMISIAVKHAPSAYNSQSARVVLLLGEHHDRFWNMVKKVLRKKVSPEKFPQTEEKIESFRNGYGTILFFEDQEVVEELQHKFPLYAERFGLWSQHSSGMLQFILWTGLESEGLGASLQHYSNLVEDEVKKEWSLPRKWHLLAQMPFGMPTVEPDEKEFEPLDKRIKIFD
ncbi:MAG: nitroreductase family protein [Synergistaceae bacterium]|nr:nitroreductase family protein [Synergistaceae bacterium]